MDMKINPELIKSERRRRAWTQQHLARAAGLGIRTIQRIERTGTAAPESVKALAAVLDLSITTLQQEPALGELPNSLLRRVGLAASIAGLILLIATFAVRSSQAENVLLNYAVTVEDRDRDDAALDAVRMGNELVSDGESVSITIAQMKLEISAAVQADRSQVLLTVKVFESVDGDYSLRAQPRVMTADREESAIRSQSATGRRLSVFLTPTIQ